MKRLFITKATITLFGTLYSEGNLVLDNHHSPENFYICWNLISNWFLISTYTGYARQEFYYPDEVYEIEQRYADLP